MRAESFIFLLSARLQAYDEDLCVCVCVCVYGWLILYSNVQ